MSSHTSSPLSSTFAPYDDAAFEQRISTLWVVMLAALVAVASLAVGLMLHQSLVPGNEAVAATVEAEPHTATPFTDHSVIARDAVSVGDAESVQASVGADGSP
jgi:hypothetical protein